MGLPRKLTSNELYKRSDPESFDFETTVQIGDPPEIVGQSRAVESIRFAAGMEHEGYNLFVLGPPGTGKRHMVERFLKNESAGRNVPGDICYANNFTDASRPRLLLLPSGKGALLKDDIEEMVEEIATTLPAAFESEEYQSRIQSAQQEFKEQHENKLEELQARAQKQGFSMMQTPMGIVFAPMKEGEVLVQEEFQKLPGEERKRLETAIEALQLELQSILRTVPRLERELRARMRELHKELTDIAIGHLIEELRQKYSDFAPVTEFLESVYKDLIQHARDLLQPPDPQGHPLPVPDGSPLGRRYGINVLVDNGSQDGAPVVHEDHPTYENLVGRMEHVSQMGTLVTDFTLIKAGALHRANGGYLILDVRRVLMQPYAWEGLKRVLKAREIKIEPVAGLISMLSLDPEPVAIDVKVILIGDPTLYYLLCQHDPDFPSLFKVVADFDRIVDRDPETEGLYAGLIAELARKHGLRPFDRGAVARIIEDSSRRAEDSERLSGHIGHLSDLVRECDYWARMDGADKVRRDHVDTAIETRIRRVDRMRERMQEQVLRETVSIDTAGATVGQINGLAVLQLDSFSFGRPIRITARVRMGKGEVVDIEREVELSGPIHSKGVLILSSFLGSRYAFDRPLSLQASLVFEQSYSGIDGDSASSTELYALLSAISGVSIKQSLAVTGSVNQLGQVQAIGGANQKIEGFFDLCAARGLSGDQGVLIPESNVKHLMLRKDVVDAVEAGQFHVYAVRTIDEGIELLTGVESGAPNEKGQYPADSINGKVAERLREMTALQRSFAAPAAAEPNSAEPSQ